MAHDPTRSWPTGKGPDDTSIPGAAWLELLDGQAFPVVGAGAMVRDGNAWTPASSSNPLHVRAQALEQLIGALDAVKETNPDAASASMLALLRGLIAIVGKEATLAQSVDKLNSILSRLEGKLDTAIFDSQGNPISAANRLPVEATLSGRLTEIRSAGVIAGGSTTPDRRESANFKNSIGALATVVHFDVKEPVWIHQLALIQHVYLENQRNVVHRLYIYDSNDNAIWLPLMNSNDAFSPQYLRMSSFINNDFSVRITEAYPWKLLPPVAWLTGQYTAGLVFTAVPLPCPHGFRFESYNPDPENAVLYRFQGMAYYTRM